MRRVIPVLLGLILIVALAGCSNEAASGTESASAGGEQTDTTDAAGSNEADHYVFGFSATTMTNAYYVTIHDKIEELVKANGDQLISVDAEQDVEKQLKYVDDLISQDIDLLFLCPVDSTSIKSALQACDEADIPVVNFDTNVYDTDLVETVIVSDNYQAGYLAGQAMAEALPDGAKIAILDAPQVECVVLRVNGFMAAVGDKFDIVAQVPCNGDTATSLSVAGDILQGNPDIAGFFAINDPASLGVVQALDAQSIEGVQVYSVDGQPIGKASIAGGGITATAAQSPLTIAETCVDCGYKIMAGEAVEPEILTEVFLIDASNVDQYGIDVWQ